MSNLTRQSARKGGARQRAVISDRRRHDVRGPTDWVDGPCQPVSEADSNVAVRPIPRIAGRSVGASVPLAGPVRPVGFALAIVFGEGLARHTTIAGRPVGFAIGRRRGERRPATRGHRPVGHTVGRAVA